MAKSQIPINLHDEIRPCRLEFWKLYYVPKIMVFAWRSQNWINVQVGIRACRLENFWNLIRFAALSFGRLKYLFKRTYCTATFIEYPWLCLASKDSNKDLIWFFKNKVISKMESICAIGRTQRKLISSQMPYPIGHDCFLSMLYLEVLKVKW